MKKILFLLFFPFSVFAQEQLSLDNILTISDKNSFLKEVIENGYSEGNSTKDKIYYGKGFKKEKTQATDWAEYTLASGEFYFEQSNLAFVRKNGNCYYLYLFPQSFYIKHLLYLNSIVNILVSNNITFF